MNQNQSYYKKVKLSSTKTAFMFDSLTDYSRFIQDIERNSIGNTRIGFDRINNPSYIRNKISEYGSAWFGTTDENLVKGELNSFLFNNRVESFLNSFSSQKVKVDIVDIDQQKAIKFTEKEIGIFSFDLASLGLIRVYEYYSPLLDRIVSPNLVKGQKGQDGKLIFYHDYMPYVPAHKVMYNLKTSGYFSNILKRNVQKTDLTEIVTDNEIYFEFPERKEIPQHIVDRKQQVDENGVKKFSSTFKRSFIDIPKIEKPLPRVDIIIAASYSYTLNVERQIIYSCMAAIAIAEKLSKSGVNYRIVACYPLETSGSGTRKEVYTFVKVKSEGEPLDKNKIAILISDGRNYRLQSFKSGLASFFDAGYDSNVNPSTIGYAISDDTKVKDAYIDFLKKQDNPEDKLAAENPNSKIVFNGALSEDQAVNQYNRIINQISKL